MGAPRSVAAALAAAALWAGFFSRNGARAFCHAIALVAGAPLLGEHTRGILEGLGFTAEQQAQLKAEGVIA